MSTLISDGFYLGTLGLQFGGHKDPTVEALTEGEFIWAVQDTNYISLVKDRAAAEHLSEILNRPVSYGESPRRIKMTEQDTLYVVEIHNSAQESDQDEIEKNYFRVYLPQVVAISVIPFSDLYGSRLF